MGGDLAFVQAFVSARYVNNFKSEVVGISEAQGDAFVPAVSAFSNRQEVDRVVLVVQPCHLQQTKQKAITQVFTSVWKTDISRL